jgi:hypothetical protein
MNRKFLDLFCYVFLFAVMLFFIDWILDILAQ